MMRRLQNVRPGGSPTASPSWSSHRAIAASHLGIPRRTSRGVISTDGVPKAGVRPGQLSAVRKANAQVKNGVQGVVKGETNVVSAWLQQVTERCTAGLGVAVTSVCAAALLVGSPALGDETRVVRMPASADPEIFAAQKTMVEAWTIVGESFVDDNFNNTSWDEELKTHMSAAYHSPTADLAYKEIQALLSDLNDPYTRIISPEEYASFRVSADGELQGVGLLIANEPESGHLLVLAPIKGSPAERAGVLPGDEVLSINGEGTRGWTGERAAKLLRGKGGTDVQVRFARITDQIPGVPGRPEPPPQVQYRDVNLKREKVALSPVYYTTVATGTNTVGYIRLASFSNNAAQEMEHAINELEAEGANSYILDLRNNPGGLVRSGIDIARMWMDGNLNVFSVISRDGDPVQQISLDGLKGGALTHDPLVVLVNENSASASEILSGALHDNGRAIIMGDGHTYGKGKIQSVYELQDGSALFVTVARYQTPGGTKIDLKGIIPDKSCTGPMALAPMPQSTLPANMKLPQGFSPGIPVDPLTEAILRNQLITDKCVLSAEDALLSVDEPSTKGLTIAATSLNLLR